MCSATEQMQQFTCDLHIWRRNVLGSLIDWITADILYTVILSHESQKSLFIFFLHIFSEVKIQSA